MIMSNNSTTKKGFCLFCEVECGIRLDINDNKIIKVQSDPTDPVSQGFVCEKSQKIKSYQEDEHRIARGPLKKINGEFYPISWDQALDEIAERLSTIRANGRADRIFFMPALSPNFECNTIYSYELMSKMGARYMSNILAVEKVYQAFASGTIYDRPMHQDPHHSQTIVSIGQNTWVTNPFAKNRIILNEIKNDPNRYLIVIDPCETETAKLADIHVKLKIGTDAWFLLAVIKILIDNDWVNWDIINNQSVNQKKIIKFFSEIDLDKYLLLCEISRDTAHKVAKMMHESTALSFQTGNGVCHGLHPLVTYYLIYLIPVLTGNCNKKGTIIHHPNFLTGQPYFQESKTPFRKKKQILGIMPAGEAVENLYINETQKFDAIITDNSNPIARYPNTVRIKEQFSKVGFHVALDSFMSNTTRIADYILPTPTYFERHEIVNVGGNVHYGYVQFLRPILDAPKNTKTSQEIYEELLNRMGLIDNQLVDQANKQYDLDPYGFLQEQLEKFNQAIPESLYILIRTVGKKHADPVITIAWWHAVMFNLKHASVDIKQAVKTADILIEELITNGNVKFNPNNFVDAWTKYNFFEQLFLSAMKLNSNKISHPDYPFTLMTGVRQRSIHNMVVRNRNDPYVEMDKLDAEELEIQDGDNVLLTSQTGTLVIKAITVETLPRKVLRIYNGFSLNFLTNSITHDHLNPQYKFNLIRVEKHI